MRWILGVALFAGVVPAQDDGNPVSVLEEMIRGGAARAAYELLVVEDLTDTLAQDPAKTREVCELAAKQATQLDLSGKDTAHNFAVAIELLAKAARTKAPDSADALWATAAAQLCHGRILQEEGKNPAPARWEKAADWYVRANAKSPDRGLALGRAVSVLLEAARLPGAPVDGLLDRALSLATQARKASPASRPAELAWVDVNLARVDRLVDSHESKAANELLRSCFDLLDLDPHSSNPDIDVATRYNEAVTLTRLHRRALHFHHEYCAAKEVALGGSLRYEIPISRRWESAGLKVHQYDETHREVRTIVFSWYSWDTEYTFTGHGKVVGGDNLKGLAEGQLLYSKDWIVQVEHKRPLVKHRLNRHVSNAYCYEIEGKDKEGEFARLRDFFFKGKHSMHTFEVFYFGEAKKEKLDPESRFVLDSIEEVKRR